MPLESTVVGIPSWSGDTPGPRGTPAPAGLIQQLGAALTSAGIPFCQWKGHLKRSRWASGEGDIDLLVDRTAAADFAAVVHRLGFKLAVPRKHAGVPGLVSYLGLDTSLARLVHIHVHFRLVIGPTWRTPYRLPIETAVLASVWPGNPFPVPSADFEFVLFVLRQTLRHQTRDLVERGDPGWLRAIQTELAYLEERARRVETVALLARHLPDIEVACFDACLASLRTGCAGWRRLAAQLGLRRRLAPFSVSTPTAALPRRIGAKVAGTIARRSASGADKHIVGGGALIALVGADGAGKSTCATALVHEFGTEIATRRAHLGRPPRTLLTLAVGGALKATTWMDERRRRSRPSSLTAHLHLARYVCTARDRWRLAVRSRRFAAAGGLAICERYPLSPDDALAGASGAQGVASRAAGRLADRLREKELSYYRRLRRPDLVLVLRIDPEVAVQRKRDEPEPYVRARARLLWQMDWSRDGVEVIDAGRPLADVLASLRERVWSAL